MRRAVSPFILAWLAACSAAPDTDQRAKGEPRGQRTAADDGRIDCALESATSFDRSCTIEQRQSGDTTILIVGKPDVGYRRLQIVTDGRGVISADGAEPATVKIIDNRLIEVRVGADRYRLPATAASAR